MSQTFEFYDVMHGADSVRVSLLFEDALNGTKFWEVLGDIPIGKYANFSHIVQPLSIRIEGVSKDHDDNPCTPHKKDIQANPYKEAQKVTYPK
jgi:hypothetical protein